MPSNPDQLDPKYRDAVMATMQYADIPMVEAPEGYTVIPLPANILDAAEGPNDKFDQDEPMGVTKAWKRKGA